MSSEPIEHFDGHEAFLSNFYPVVIRYEGLEYPSVEHAYQAQKTLLPHMRQAVRDLRTSAAAKKWGRHLTPLRPDWSTLKFKVMRELLELKFQHPDLRAKLIATYPRVLIESNTWNDRVWGMCRGEGENHLGRMLMSIRDSLVEQERPQ